MIRSVKTAVLGAVMAVAVAGIAGAQTSTNPGDQAGSPRPEARPSRPRARPARRAGGPARHPRRQARRTPGRQVGPVQGRAAGPPRRQTRPPGHRRRQARHSRRQAGHSSGSPAHRQSVTSRLPEGAERTHGPPRAPPGAPGCPSGLGTSARIGPIHPERESAPAPRFGASFGTWPGSSSARCQTSPRGRIVLW